MDAVTFQQSAMQLERLMYHVSYSMLGHNEDCADAVQEALTRAWQKRDSLRTLSAFKPWLMRILINTCRDVQRIRQRRRSVPLEEDAAAVDPPEEPLPLWEAVEQLDPDRRIIVLMYYSEGMTIQEVSEALGVPSGTVKTRLRSARKLLANMLKDPWEEAATV